jgi:hypothetical protein
MRVETGVKERGDIITGAIWTEEYEPLLSFKLYFSDVTHINLYHQSFTRMKKREGRMFVPEQMD